MDTRLRREALRAAAKLAFGTISSVGLVACGGKTDFSRDVSVRSEDRAVLGAPPDAAAAPSDAACACPRTVVLEDVFTRPPNFTRAEVDCCAARVEASTASPAAAPGTDPELGNCCDAIVAAVDVGMLSFTSVTSSVRQACCFAGPEARQQPRFNHNLCSPWGPPVPPEMSWSVEDVV
jgi:hypothetical protein